MEVAGWAGGRAGTVHLPSQGMGEFRDSTTGLCKFHPKGWDNLGTGLCSFNTQGMGEFRDRTVQLPSKGWEILGT